jgi:Flp pilus assembly pilin Flp
MRPGTVDRLKRGALCLLVDDRGQDLVEYALLTGIIAVAGAIVFPTIRSKMAAAYAAWITNAQSLWEPAPPL